MSRDRVVVLGDTLLDADIRGSVQRVCPDAPVPVVDEISEDHRPGGAGLAAVLTARDGRPTTLITALGTDAAGQRLRCLLDEAGVDVVDVGLQGPTPEKLRVRAGDQSVVRIDRGGPPPPINQIDASDVERALQPAAAILVADYGRGVTSVQGIRSALHAAGVRRPLVWDPHPRGAAPVEGARLVTPNESEAARFAPEDGASGLARTTVQARTMRRRWQAASVAVTLGCDGALFVDGDGTPLVIPAHPAAGDSCGAGDRFASAAAQMLADGALPSEAVTVAVASASAFVAAGGASAVVGDRRLRPQFQVAGADESPFALAERVRDAGGTVVATGGCFDIVHAGHVQLLATARALGDCLIVLLNSDESVRRLKGAERPYVGERDRAALLHGLRGVDAVMIFDDDTPVAALERLRPHVFVKGADYSVADIPEAEVLARWGGQAVAVPYLQGRSTTRIAQEVARRGNQ